MLNNELISVVIPVYNCEKYIAKAVESVIRQDYHPLEIIVINDGSTDKSGEIIESFLPQIKYHCQENKGLASALNQGIKLTTGNYITFLDQDDLWLENKLNTQIGHFNNNSDLDIVFAHCQQFKSPELSAQEKQKIKIVDEIIPAYFKGTMMIKKESFFRVGYFDENINYGEFVDWYFKAKESNLNILMLSDVFLKRRIHTTNMGITHKKNRREYAQIIKRSLDRRRQRS